MKKREKHEAGSVLIAFALFLTLLLSFAAVATEGGRWFLVRAELSKSVDAGALAGAKNISNPNASALTLAEDFCAENFQNGYLGTPGAGMGSVTFKAEMVGTSKVKVSGNASAVAILGKIVGFNLVPVSASGAAAMREVEIMMILDRSGSMSGTPMTNLKIASRSFLDYFVDTQDKDKMGLITFSTAARVDRAMGTNYVTPMKTAITAMSAKGYTNPEDAIDQSDGPQGFTNQNGVPSDDRVKQFAIFFSDGRPNTFRWTFKNSNVTYDACAHCNGNCDDNEAKSMGGEAQFLWRPDNGQALMAAGRQVRSLDTGDGVFPGSRYGNVSTTRWNVFDSYPVSGYAPDAYNIPDARMHDQTCGIARSLARLHAQELKDAGVTVFAIGLGSKINDGFLEEIASGPDQAYTAYTAADLPSLFTKVAQEIKLRLVQ